MSLLLNASIRTLQSDVWRNASSNSTQPARRPGNAGQFGQGHLALMEDMRFILIGVVGPMWELAGLITSFLSIVLLKLDKSIQMSVRIILIALAVADVFFLFGSIFCIQLDLYGRRFNLAAVQNIDRVLRFPSCSVVNIAEMFRNWLTVLIGIERFIATSFPLSARRLCSARRVSAAIGIIFCGSVLLRVPYVYRRWLRDTLNLTQQELSQHALAELAHKIHTNVDSYGLVIVPLIILTVLSTLIIRNISLSQSLHSRMNSDLRRKSKPTGAPDAQKAAYSPLQSSEAFNQQCHNRNTTRSLPRHEHRRNQVVKMLLVILLLFAVFGVPQIVHVIVEYLRLPTEVRRIIIIVVWTSSMIYSNTNFFVYIAYMAKYREMLKIVVCKLACTYKRWQHFYYIEQCRTQSLTVSTMCDSAYFEVQPGPKMPLRAGSVQRPPMHYRCVSMSAKCGSATVKTMSSVKRVTPAEKAVRCNTASGPLNCEKTASTIAVPSE